MCPLGHAVYQSSAGRKFDLWGMNDSDGVDVGLRMR